MHREIRYDPIFDSQSHFRVLLQVMSQPGSIQSLSFPSLHLPDSLFVPSALVGFALLNRDVQFYHAESLSDWREYLIVNTSSQWAPANEADFLFLNTDSPSILSDIQAAKLGEWRYPDTSATLIIQVASIQEASTNGMFSLKLKGPGIQGERFVYMEGLSQGILEQVFPIIKEANTEYPLGLDVFWTDREGKVMGMPRTCQVDLG